MAWDLAAFLEEGAIVADGDEVWVGTRPAFDRAPSPSARSLFAPDFFLSTPRPWATMQDQRPVPRRELARELELAPRERWTVDAERAPDPDAFARTFAEITAGIQTGRWRKVVPVVFWRYRCAVGPGQIAHALSALLRLPPSLVGYGVWSRGEGCLGATPEWLLRVEGRHLRTMALAGTRHRADAPPLLEDPKQRHEHDVVVRDIAEALAPFGTVAVGELSVRELPGLQHLETPIEVELTPGADFERLVRALHPTPALGASPRGAADGLLRSLDRDGPRERFGAPFGWRDPDGSGAALVAIRNVQWRGGELAIGAGGGIVSESEVGDEWLELQAKQASVRRSLGL